jgi:transposase InsO family protein
LPDRASGTLNALKNGFEAEGIGPNFNSLLKQHGIRQSTGHKGNYWDNAVSKSVFHTLKTE